MSDTILTDSSLLSLAITGLQVELRCNDQKLTDQLQARYHPYLAPATPHLTADVHQPAHSHPGHLADANTASADDALRLAAPGYDGAVDVKQGRARLRLYPDYSIESTEVLGWEKPKDDNC